MTFKHTKQVKGLTMDNQTLAEGVGDLYYDALAEFLGALSHKLQQDGDADATRGRKKLAASLHNSAQHLQQAAEQIGVAWEICAPYVAQWEAENGSNR